MAFVHQSNPVPLGAIGTFKLVQTIDDLMQSLRDGFAARRARAQLQTLSDHQLEDIGLTRGMICDLPLTHDRRSRR